MTMNTTKEKVLQTIKEKNLRPRHTIFFAIKHITAWCIWTLAVLVGAFVFSALLFQLLNEGFGYHAATPSHTALSSLSLLWIGLLALSSGIAFVQFRSTERGHTIPWGAAILTNILLSLLIGSVLFFFGFGYVSEHTALRFKGTTVERAYLIRQHNAQQGIIIGTVTAINDNTLSLQGIDGKGYLADISGLTSTTIPTNVPIRVIGAYMDNNDLYACRIAAIRFRGAFRREERAWQRIDEIKADNERTTLCRDIPTN